MLKSMTGFGRGSIEEDGKSYIIEIKSVNHRYLDVNIKMPRNMISLEDRIRKTISGTLDRGKVDVFITQNILASNDAIANFNDALANSYYKILQKIKNNYDVRDDISVSLIARFPDVITLSQQEEDIEKTWNSMSVPLKEALNKLISMREKEGIKLKEDILGRCGYIKSMVDTISERAPIVVQEYKDKLDKRLKDLMGEISIDESRLAAELAVFADKSNIDEEIVRLNSHLNQMKETLNLNEPIGRKLDFIVQEMNRETNTIASKANDLELVNISINIKNEIEKIREQIQNIE